MLLDTGADTCTLPSYVATFLGYDMTIPSTNSTKGVGGVSVATWQHDFVVGLLDPSEKQVLKMNERSPMNCVGHDDLPVILGTNNFLKDFKIIIDYPNKTITLTW